MRLTLCLPTRTLREDEVAKVVAEAPNGAFGILPRHIDFVAALVPGILSITLEDGQEIFFGIHEGILVKRGPEVMISVRDAVKGEDLATLRRTVEREFLELDERERTARAALARLEAGVVRRFIQLEEQG
jgi:F-type H+-transporting ATPase subunit epsilon